MAGGAESFLLAFLAIIFPPIAVVVLTGCGIDACVNFLLTLLGWFPGCIHAFWLIIKRAEANELYGYNNWSYEDMGRYVARGARGAPSAAYTDQPPPPPPPAPAPSQPAPSQAPPPPLQAQAQPSGAPIDQKGGNEPTPAPPPATLEGKPAGYQDSDRKTAPADQKDSAEQAPPVPPPAVPDQK